MPRANLLRGPGALIFDAATIFSKDDISADLDLETDETPSAAYGNVGDVVLDARGEIGITPLGEWEHLTKLWPYASTIPGTSLFGVDKPIVIHTLDGEILTFKAGAVTEMPEIICGPAATLIGPAKLTGIRAADAEWSVADSLYTVSAGAFASHAAFSKAAVLRVAFTAAWGAVAPWDAIRTTDGWRISFNLTYDWVPDAGRGGVDATFSDVQVMARCTPLGLNSEQIQAKLGIQGGTARRGQSLATADNLVLTGAGGSPSITLNKPGLKTAGYKFGRTTLRHGEIGLVAQRTFGASGADPLFILA